MPKRYIRRPDGTLIEDNGVAVDSSLAISGAAADAKAVGDKFGEVAKTIADLEGSINGVKTWDYTEGLPEVDGYEYVGTQGKAVMQSNGVSLSAGAQYNFPFANAPESEIEFKFTITKKSSSYWGFVVIVSNGTNGIRLSMQNGVFYFCENTSNNIKVADISENAEHTLKVDFFDTAKADVYLDGVKIITNSISYPTYTTTLFQQNGSGTTVLHSITYRIPAAEREYIPVPETAAVGQTIVVKSVDENGKPTAWKAEDFPRGTDGGGGTDTSLGITGATVGQIPQVSAVDESGVPIAWLPADFPSGGGGENAESVQKVVLTEEVSAINLSCKYTKTPFTAILDTDIYPSPSNTEDSRKAIAFNFIGQGVFARDNDVVPTEEIKNNMSRAGRTTWLFVVGEKNMVALYALSTCGNSHKTQTSSWGQFNHNKDGGEFKININVWSGAKFGVGSVFELRVIE